MTDIHRVFCYNLTQRRLKLGMTQEELAEKLDASLQYAQQLEYGYQIGKQWPRPDKIRQLARILKCDTTELFKAIKKT